MEEPTTNQIQATLYCALARGFELAVEDISGERSSTCKESARFFVPRRIDAKDR